MRIVARGLQDKPRFPHLEASVGRQLWKLLLMRLCVCVCASCEARSLGYDWKE